MEVDEGEEVPRFAPITEREMTQNRDEMRQIAVPPNRMSALRKEWSRVYSPLVEHLKLQVRMNTTSRRVEMKSSEYTEEVGALQKGEDFVRAFMLGFEIDDALALLRLDDLYIDSFEVTDVKSRLQGDNLARAVGRIAGHNGRTKFAIENATRTRIVLADTRVSILGTVDNIRMAKDAICALILGSPPGKVYAKLRDVSARSRRG